MYIFYFSILAKNVILMKPNLLRQLCYRLKWFYYVDNIVFMKHVISYRTVSQSNYILYTFKCASSKRLSKTI